MEKHVFQGFCRELTENYGLSRTRNVSIEEMVAMFLITLGHGLGNRMIQERFQHSGETVSRHFIKVLDAVYKMSTNIIEPIDREFKEVPHKIRSDNRYYPFFKDCIGAIDGTHVPVVVP